MVLPVKQIMQEPLLIDYGKSARMAGEMMRKNRRYSLVVTRGNLAVGLVTDSDLIKKIIAKNKTPSSVKIKSIMSSPLVTISPEEDVMKAATIMKKNKIKRLVVVKGDEILGVIELSDVARASPEMMDLLEFKIKMRDNIPEIVEEKTSGICDSCGNYSTHLKKLVDGRWVCESCRDEIEE
jgi:CBS domain-containing protein